MRTFTPGFELGTLNPYVIKPNEIKEGDRLGYKVVTIINTPFWKAYRGPTGWADEQIAFEGDEVSQELAEMLFPACRDAGLIYG
jgi:hypothetical protein